MSFLVIIQVISFKPQKYYFTPSKIEHFHLKFLPLKASSNIPHFTSKYRYFRPYSQTSTSDTQQLHICFEYTSVIVTQPVRTRPGPNPGSATRRPAGGPHLGIQTSFFNLILSSPSTKPSTTPKTSLPPMTDSSPDVNLNPGDRAPAGLPRAARRRTGSRDPGPLAGPTPGRQAQRLDAATDHLTSTLAT